MVVELTRTAPPLVPTGLTATAVHGWIQCFNTETGLIIDRLIEFTTPANDVDSFAAAGDYIYFAIDSTMADDRAADIHLAFSQVASESILPVFEYSTGLGTWATLTVIDGTNGFTQDGSILIGGDTYPSTGAWKDEIIEGETHRYFRIKRTTPTLATVPQISECGSGVLSASMTYYYTAIATANSTVYPGGAASKRRSAPTSEINTTTTAIKRTIRLDFDTAGEKYVIWRTATPEQYNKYGINNGVVGSGLVDDECQTVKGNYFLESCGTGGADSVLMDNGMPDAVTGYSSTYGNWAYYRDVLWMDCERGDLIVESSDSSPVTIGMIYDECQANGWTDAVRKLHYSHIRPDRQRREIWETNDNMDIRDYFSAVGMTLYLHALFTTVYCTNATFGIRSKYGSSYYNHQGVEIILAQNICYNGRLWFKNTTFAECKFIQAAINDNRIYAHFPILSENCKIYDCMIDGYSAMEQPQLNGANMVVQGLKVSGTRHGLVINSSHFDTLTMSKVTIQGGEALYNGSPYWVDGQDITYDEFTFIGQGVFVISYSKTSNEATVTLNFVNPTFHDSEIERSRGGLSWIYNEQYTFDLLITNTEGVPISDAVVSIVDVNGLEVGSGTTDENGRLDTETVTYKRYTGGTLVNAAYQQYFPDVIEILTPHTVTVSAVGYEGLATLYFIDKKTEQVKVLQSPSTPVELVVAALAEDITTVTITEDIITVTITEEDLMEMG